MHPSLRLYCLAAGLLLSLSSLAQKNFQNGYVILRSKDTLQGQIDYREWDVNPHSIVFRDARGSISEYTPDALAGFAVNGENYSRKVRPFLDLGATNVVVMGNKNRQDTYDNLDNSHSTGPLLGINGAGRSFEFGITGGGGVQAGHFSLEVRAESLNGPSEVSGIALPITTFSFLASYTF